MDENLVRHVGHILFVNNTRKKQYLGFQSKKNHDLYRTGMQK